MHVMNRTTLLITFMIMVNILSGCGDNEYIRPENAHNFRNRDIVVTLRSGSKVFFNHDQYTIDQDSDGKYISGSGRAIQESDTSKSIPQETIIYFREIEEIRLVDKIGSAEKSINVLIVGGTIAAAAILVFYLTLGYSHN